ncbi:MAG: hypothetical protein WBG38_13955, partial [Nodosilinea sp.]
MDKQQIFDLTATSSKLALIPHIFLSESVSKNGPVDEVVVDALSAIRVYLGMEVAFVSEFAEGRRQFRYI